MLYIGICVQDTQTLCFRKAELIELNADLVERALTFMRAALAQGYSWDEIDVCFCEFLKSTVSLGVD
jgi:hypothetical protein